MFHVWWPPVAILTLLIIFLILIILIYGDTICTRMTQRRKEDAVYIEEKPKKMTLRPQFYKESISRQHLTEEVRQIEMQPPTRSHEIAV